MPFQLNPLLGGVIQLHNSVQFVEVNQAPPLRVHVGVLCRWKIGRKKFGQNEFLAYFYAFYVIVFEVLEESVF